MKLDYTKRRRFISIFFIISLCQVNTRKVTYINVEHPHVAYINPKHFNFFNLTTHRYGRRNPIYYVDVVFQNVVPLDSKHIVAFYFYELLTNQYKRSFIEVQHNWCDLIEKDPFFGAAMRQGKMSGPCPYKPDVYFLWNMTINPAIIPPGFPFTKGRIYCNITEAKTNALMGTGHIDMAISQMDETKAKSVFVKS